MSNIVTRIAKQVRSAYNGNQIDKQKILPIYPNHATTEQFWLPHASPSPNPRPASVGRSKDKAYSFANAQIGPLKVFT
jgi:hypothetical protein